MARNDNRPEFTPNTEPYAPNTIEEQKRDHERYWDDRHDVELADKLDDALRRRTVDILTGSKTGRIALIDLVQELRLTTY